MADYIDYMHEYHRYFQNHPLFLKFRFTRWNGQPLTDESYDGQDCEWIKHGCRVHPVLFNVMYMKSGTYLENKGTEYMNFKIVNAGDHVLTVRKQISQEEINQIFMQSNTVIFEWATEIHKCLHKYERQNLAENYVLELED